MRGVGYPDRRQISRPMTTRQFLGVTAIRFHPVTRFGGDQRRRYHLTLHPQRCQLPIENVAGWPAS